MKLIGILILPFLFSFRPNIAFYRSNLTAGGVIQNFIKITPRAPYTTKEFYIAKYEMKNVGGIAFSRAVGLPWVNITRADAIIKCRAIGAGYDLISNEEWQTVAREIAEVNQNWSTGQVGIGFLNSGHSDGVPAQLLEASIDDDKGNCAGTGQTCGSTLFDKQRRTHFLKNGEQIWDFAGNAFEVTSNSNSVSQGVNAYTSLFIAGENRSINFGTDTACDLKNVSPYCGFGYGAINYTSGAIWRGGYYSDLDKSGIFAAKLNVSSLLTASYMGFRCVYRP